jgi:aminopeptidase N
MSSNSRKNHVIFLYSQHCRLPCFDTPGAKATYSAQISCPKPLVVVMSAENTKVESNEEDSVYHFKQEIATPVS